MRVLIKQGRACNNDCVFCHASDRTRAADPIANVTAKIDAAKAAGAHTVVLSGGEPTVRAELLLLAELVRSRGLRLGLVTNGRRLADAHLVDALVERGLDYAYVSLHGSRQEVHDPLVGAQAFDQTLAAIRHLHGRVALLSVNTVVTRANLGDLRNLVDLLRPLPLLCQKFTMPQPKGAAWARFDEVVPTLNDAARAVSDAIAYGQRSADGTRSERFGFEGFPLCLLPGLERLLTDLRSHEISLMSEPEDTGLEPVDDVLLIKPPRCNACRLRPRCPGIYRDYAARRGDSELKPVGPARLHHAMPITATGDAEARPVEVAADREDAAHEQRAWVRLTYACNNRCAFCLDRGSGHSGHRQANTVREEILDGRRRGADRLILSGGEATTHPAFLEFVSLGKRAGYRWIQTVSNGRMFAYPKFVARVVAAGLDEVTFSMHGHRAELHDKLVGVPGAFDQASRGLHAALQSGRLVVNIDVVINALNVRHLPEMLETFLGWGVSEFDLLHLIPFGGAWEPQNRHLFYDPAEHIDALRKTLEFSKRPGVHLWLNRFPPAHAEGFEALIQDPHKLHDEMRGRADELRVYLEGGPPLVCREPERCRRCYLQDTCDALARTLHASREVRVEHLRASLPLPEGVPLPACTRAELHASSATQVLQALSRFTPQSLRLHLVDIPSLAPLLAEDETLGGVRLDSLVVDSPAALAQALKLPGRFDIVVELNARTAVCIAGLREHAGRLVLVQPTHDRISTALHDDVELPSWFASLPFEVRTEGIAPCLSGIVPEPSAEPLDLDAFDVEGKLDAQRFVGVFVRHGFMTRSLRCSTCTLERTCRGMHINWVRAHGYASMRPEACATLKSRPAG